MRRIEIHRRRVLLVRIAALALTLYVIGCASTSVTPVGTERHARTSPDQDVFVFNSEADVKGTFQVVGIITHNDPGKYQVLTLDDAIPALKKKAREVGANGVIIDQYFPVKSGLISTGISVRARAIIVQQ